MRKLNLKLIRDLKNLRGQIIAIVAVMACGITTFITMQNTYRSLLITQQNYYHNYHFADLFAQLKRAPNTVAEKIAAIPGVASVQTRIVLDVTLNLPDLTEPATGRLISIPAGSKTMLNDLYLQRGRYLEPGRLSEIIISEAFAEANRLQLNDKISAIINGQWREFQIVGIGLSPEYIYEVRGAGEILPDNRRFGVIWVDREMLAGTYNMKGAFNDVALSLSPGANQALIIDQLDRLLEKYGCFGAYGRDEQISNRFISDEIAQNRAQALFIPPIFLAVAIFLLHMVLSRLVSTQRNQIAILKAFGFSNIDIGLHYLKFTLVAVIAGTIVGTISGLWFGWKLTQVYTLFYRFPILDYQIDLSTILIAASLSIISASLGAISAVRKVIKLPPAEAMQPESPAQYHPLWIEKLNLQHLLSPVTRMILRNIERTPWKAFFTVTGIACAIAILIIGPYIYGAIDYILDLQFRKIQRQDISVIFIEPRASRACFDLKNLPGVLRVEPFRNVAVRLRAEHKQRRVSIQGLAPNSELHQLLDTTLNHYQLPVDGLVLNTHLAKLLDISINDLITVEILEGERRRVRLRVVGLVDEMFGLSAYMNITALNRLMMEGKVISGANLTIDPIVSTQLYQSLKRTPAIKGISIREASIAGFETTMAESMKISNTVIIIFACIIAFGLIYNNARIALSERARELASLRIVGFSQIETALMLLGEQALLIIVAIPFGFLLGYGFCYYLAARLETEMLRIPLIINGEIFALAFIVIVIAATISSLIVLQRLKYLDLLAVLKARE